MTELKYGGNDVAKLMFGDVEVSRKTEVVNLSTKKFTSVPGDFDLGITRQELLNPKHTKLLVSYVDWTSTPNIFYNLNQSLAVEELLDTGTIEIQSNSIYPIMKLELIKDKVYLTYPYNTERRSLSISVSAC